MTTDRASYFAWLDKRVNELHKTGKFPGVLARREADREYAVEGRRLKLVEETGGEA